MIDALNYALCGFPSRTIRRLATVALIAGSISGCLLMSSPPPEEDLSSVVRDMVAQIAMQTSPQSIQDTLTMAESEQDDLAVLGFREADGKQTDRTEALDQALISAAIHSGMPLSRDSRLTGGEQGTDGFTLRWSSGKLLPQNWAVVPARRLLTGQVRYEPPWAYLRLVIADRESGMVLGTARAKVAQSEIERRGRAIAKLRPGDPATGSDFTATIDFHLLVRREDGQFAQLVEVVENGTLRAGDKLQLRFRVDRTCAVYAFLQQSNGDREDIFSRDRIYGGRLQYGPGEENWINLNKVNEVYTLYFIAAERLQNERREDLFEEITDLVRQGQLTRFQGVDVMDAKIVEFLQSQIEGLPAIEVVRAAEDVIRGENETFVYGNGESFDSAPEILKVEPVLVRAYTFQIQYN